VTVILAPEDLEKSVILENFEEILKTCFDNTKFCDFPTPVLSQLYQTTCAQEKKIYYLKQSFADGDKSRKILRLKESCKCDRKDWRRVKNQFSSSETAKYLQRAVFSDSEELIFSRIITLS